MDHKYEMLEDLQEIAYRLDKQGDTYNAGVIRAYIDRSECITKMASTINLNKTAEMFEDEGLNKYAFDIDSIIKEAGIIDGLSGLWQGAKGFLGAEGALNRVLAAVVGYKAQEFANKLTSNIDQRSHEKGGKLIVTDIPGLIWDAIKDITPQLIKDVMGKVGGMVGLGGQGAAAGAGGQGAAAGAGGQGAAAGAGGQGAAGGQGGGLLGGLGGGAMGLLSNLMGGAQK